MTTPDDMMRTGLQQYFDAHQFPDTDNDASAIHHTLGSGSREAAPGNHQHTDLLGKWYRNAARNIGTSNWTILHLDKTEFYSPSVFERVGPGNGTIRVKREGFYLAYLKNEWANNTVGGRAIRATVNGSARDEKTVPAQPAFEHTMEIQYLLQLDPLDVVAFEVWQNSGGALAVGVGGSNVSFMYLLYLGETPLDFLLNEDWF